MLFPVLPDCKGCYHKTYKGERDNKYPYERQLHFLPEVEARRLSYRRLQVYEANEVREQEHENKDVGKGYQNVL